MSPLWLGLVAVGVALAIAAATVAVALGLRRDAGPTPGPIGSLGIVGFAADGRVVRAVTEEGGCRRPVFAEVNVGADRVELRVMGQSPGTGCTAEIKLRCSEVRLPPAAAGKRLVGTRVRVPARLCAPIPLR